MMISQITVGLDEYNRLKRIERAVRRLPSRWRNRVEQYEAYESEVAANQRGTFRQCADDLERALATHPADGDSPAVPDGYVLVPKEPTPNMLRTGEEARMEMSYRTTFPKARAVYEAMIAAAPTPTDDGEK